MTTTTNTGLTTLLLITSISTSAISLPYDSSGLIPNMNQQYEQHQDISEWNENVFNKLPAYSIQEEERYKTIIEFSQKIFNNSRDIDSEFVDIVNENFWDLI